MFYKHRLIENKIEVSKDIEVFIMSPNRHIVSSNQVSYERRVPVNLRNSGDHDAKMLISQRIRKSPFHHLSQEAGAWCYTTYNRIYHPRAYIPKEEGGLLKEYEYLTEHVSMWNVAVERQIQVKGPDAAKFIDLIITRSVDKIKPGTARYVILCNQYGGILNDPVLLRLSDDEFWFSLSDSDIGIYLQGIQAVTDYDVDINEIDVCPVQIQGPKSKDLIVKLFGDEVKDMPYYGLMETDLNGLKVILSQTGFSTEKGYEIFLYDATRHADAMWNAVLEAGEEFNLRIIAPGHIRRIEAGILSWGQDMDIETNPYQCGLAWQVDFSKENFIGKNALQDIKNKGVTHKLAGIKMGGEPIDWYPADFYHVFHDNEVVGYVTSGFYSPAMGCNIGYAMLPVGLTDDGTELQVKLDNQYAKEPVWAETVPTPFKNPEAPGTGLSTMGRKL